METKKRTSFSLSHVIPLLFVLYFLSIFPGYSQTNLITNGGFESGTIGWTSWSAALTPSSDAHTGALAAKISNRKNSYEALVRDIASLIVNGKEYELSFWTKLTGQAVNLRATIALTVDGKTTYQGHCLTASPVIGSYLLSSELFTLSWTGNMTSANLYFETDAVGGVYSDYIIDDVSLVPTIPDTGVIVFPGLGFKNIKSTMKIGGCVTEGGTNYFTSPKAMAQVFHDCNTATVQCYPAWGRWDENLKYVYHLDAFNSESRDLKEQNLLVTAHMLAGWDQYFPDWYKNNDFEPDTLDVILKSWIESIITYKGDDTLVDTWNIVNETQNWDGKGGYWPIFVDNHNNACELQRIGFEADASGLPAAMIVNPEHPVYIRKAFEYARTYTSKKLELRDAAIEFPTDSKYKSFYQLVVHLKNLGTPLDVIGFQTHLDLEKVYDWEGYANNIKRYRALGLEVIIPEVDFGDTKKAWSEEKAELQKIGYYQLVTAAIKGGASDFQTWGFADGTSGWRAGESALIYTNKFEPKPAYFGIQEALIDMSHILYWEMDNAVNDTLPDVMTYNNFGVLNHFDTPAFVTGFKSKALQFDGVDDYISSPVLSDSISGDFTLSFLIKTSSVKQSIIADVALEDASGLQLGMNTEGRIYLNALEAGLNSDLTSTPAVNDGEWHFIALRRDSATYKIYVDTISPNVSAQGSIQKFLKLIVGAKSDGTYSFEGILDEVRLYDTPIEEASYVRNLVPVPPMNLSLSKTKMMMKLSWLDQSINEDGFIIERKVKNGEWEELAFVATNKKNYSDTVSEYNTEYSYRIRAFNKFGKSGYTKQQNTNQSFRSDNFDIRY
jgi:GH35 family endo-1,4-beta-xylanase